MKMQRYARLIIHELGPCLQVRFRCLYYLRLSYDERGIISLAMLYNLSPFSKE